MSEEERGARSPTGEDVESRLARLAEATNEIRPRADFNARVMQAVSLDAAVSGGGGAWSDFLVPARRFLPVAAIFAALAVVWAMKSESAFDDAVAATDDAVEVEW